MKNPASEGVSADHHKNKQIKLIDRVVCFCCKGSFSSCMPIWHRRFWQSVTWHKFWSDFWEKTTIFWLQLGVVYKTPCVTVRTVMSVKRVDRFFTRKKQTAAKSSQIIHGNTSIIDKANYLIRKFLNAWHTVTTPNADNNSRPLPGQYSILFSPKKFCSCIF